MLEQPDVVPDAHRAQPYVDVGESDREEADERPLHVPAIEAARAIVGEFARRFAGERVPVAADDMAHGVATERVASEEHDVRGEDDRTQPDAELLARDWRVEPH